MTELFDQIVKLEQEAAFSILEKAAVLSSRIRFSTSFGKEDQAITQLIAQNTLPISIFTIDTGRLFEETNATFDRTIKKYNLKIDVFYPDYKMVEDLVSNKGPYSFYDSVADRKFCCNIRKIAPLKRALSGFDIWITGLRSEQSENRSRMKKVEWDSTNNIIKVHPLLDWSAKQLDAYLDTHNIPINPLHAKGYPSIGCSSCTRAVLPGEVDRAGRWWWENSQKECGLHESK